MLNTKDRFKILDCEISAATTDSALEAVSQRIQDKSGGYICFSNVHTVVTSRKDLKLRESTNGSFLSLPDGKPLSVYARKKGYSQVEQVAGPDFMPLCIERFPEARHFFYGSTDEVLDKLKDNLLQQNPSINIAGMYSPPFRHLNQDELDKIHQMINESRPDFIWVGLGAPKQEIWMMENFDALKPAILFGVGAAFDFHAGLLQRCPKWMQKSGLEWFYRFIKEPKRLWRRYLVTNTSFLFHLTREELITGIYKPKGQ